MMLGTFRSSGHSDSPQVTRGEMLMVLADPDEWRFMPSQVLSPNVQRELVLFRLPDPGVERGIAEARARWRRRGWPT